MVSSVVILASVATLFVIILVGMALSKWVTERKHGKNPMIKIPRKKRSVLQNTKEWGTAEVYASLPLAPNWSKARLFMTTLNGQRITRDLHREDIEPDNPLQAICPTDAPLWHMKGTSPFEHNINNDKLELEAKSMQMRQDIHKLSVDKKIITNEAFIIPDKMEEIIGRLANVGKSGDVIVEKKR